MKKNVTINYYAFLRDERGVASEEVETPAGTARELYMELKAHHNFSLTMDALKVSVNNEFSSWDTQLRDGDHVVFIPPVSGG